MSMQFQVIQTKDGSPTLRWSQGELCEDMHNSGGAYSETQYVYGWAVRQGLDQGLRSFVSVGLGLGYNEILIAAECVKRGISPQEISLRSFESVPELKTNFLGHINGEGGTSVYSGIFLAFQEASLSAEQIKAFLRELFKIGNWLVDGALCEETIWNQKYQIFLYDAYCGQSSPQLWEEKFLTDFFSKACAEKSIFTTYACKGSLKRALRANAFEVEEPDGFGKRQCTRAVRFCR